MAPGRTPVPVYFSSSASNQTRRFADALARQSGRPVLDLGRASVRRCEAPGPWVLVTPSYKAGSDNWPTLPAAVRRFLRSPVNRRRLVGIIGSGNRNFGVFYQAAARELARVSGRPIVFEFELAGTAEDVQRCGELLAELDAGLAKEPTRPASEISGRRRS